MSPDQQPLEGDVGPGTQERATEDMVAHEKLYKKA